MPTIDVHGVKLAYAESGAGPEPIVFGHGLAFDGRMFDAQVAAFRDRYRCLTFDLRGHGGSDLPASGFDMDTLTEDAIGLLETLSVGPCHFVGWSISGFTGMRLALRRPDLLRSLTLIGTAAIDGSETGLGFKVVPFMSRTFGMRAISGALMKSMFSREFLKDPAQAVLAESWRRRFIEDRPLGVSRAAKGVLQQRSIESELGALKLPVLMIRGELDTVVPDEPARRTTARIAGAEMVTIPRSGHACTIESPRAVNGAIERFLGAQASSAKAS
jgi:pimeloyl-ACP methyl ester carboxylesterase